MLVRFGSCLKAHGESLVVGGVILGLLAGYDGLVAPVSGWLYWFTLQGAFAIAFYRAWLTEWKRTERLSVENSRLTKQLAERRAEAPAELGVAPKAGAKVGSTAPGKPREMSKDVSVVADNGRTGVFGSESPGVSPDAEIGGQCKLLKYVSRRVVELAAVDSLIPYLGNPTFGTAEWAMLTAFVVDFRLEADAENEWSGVWAEIVYRDEAGEEVAKLALASWVGTGDATVNFDRTATRSVILATKRREGGWVGVGPENRYVGSLQWCRELKLVDLGSRVWSADVVLRDEQGRSMAPKQFVLDFELGLFGERELAFRNR